MKHEQHDDGRDLLLAGERAMPGLYRQVETGRLIRLEQPDSLPGSCDGRVVCYVCVSAWVQIDARRTHEDDEDRAAVVRRPALGG